MTGFMNYNFNLSKITLACYVPKGGANVHRNRPSHGLALYLGGEKSYVFDNGKRLEVCKNKMIYLPKGSNYDVLRIADGDCYAINFELSDFPEFEPFTVKVKNADRLLELFKSSQKLWNIKSQGYEMECKANLYHVLSILQQEAISAYIPNEKAQMIAPAVEYIRNHYTEGNLSISALSELCGITPEYFRQIFKTIHGDSPLAYINRLKLTNVKELLDSGMYTITDAAEASGYNDMSHFSRAFKMAYGISARDYIKQL